MKTATLLIAVMIATIGNTQESKKLVTAADKANTEALAAAVHDYMLAAYSCQDYLGGLESYRTAKNAAENIFVKMGIDRNKAVLMLQRGEDTIKATYPQTQRQMEAFSKQPGIVQADVKKGCQETVVQAKEQVRLLQAKLNLL